MDIAKYIDRVLLYFGLYARRRRLHNSVAEVWERRLRTLSTHGLLTGRLVRHALRPSVPQGTAPSRAPEKLENASLISFIRFLWLGNIFCM